MITLIVQLLIRVAPKTNTCKYPLQNSEIDLNGYQLFVK